MRNNFFLLIAGVCENPFMRPGSEGFYWHLRSTLLTWWFSPSGFAGGIMICFYLLTRLPAARPLCLWEEAVLFSFFKTYTSWHVFKGFSRQRLSQVEPSWPFPFCWECGRSLSACLGVFPILRDFWGVSWPFAASAISGSTLTSMVAGAGGWPWLTGGPPLGLPAKGSNGFSI